MSYIGGSTVAAATVLPMTSGALYIWSRSVNTSVATVFLVVSVLSLLFSVSMVARYYINSKKNN